MFTVVWKHRKTGVITWITFPNKTEFEKSYTKEREAVSEVIATDVSIEECVRLVRSTPFSARVKLALERSAVANGVIDEDKFRYELRSAQNAMLL